MALKVMVFAALISLASCQSSEGSAGEAAEKEYEALLNTGADFRKRCASATKIYGDEDNPEKFNEWHEMEREQCEAAEEESLRKEWDRQSAEEPL